MFCGSPLVVDDTEESRASTQPVPVPIVHESFDESGAGYSEETYILSDLVAPKPVGVPVAGIPSPETSVPIQAVQAPIFEAPVEAPQAPAQAPAAEAPAQTSTPAPSPTQAPIPADAASDYYDDSNDETTIIAPPEPVERAYLHLSSTDQDIEVNKTPFILGRKRSEVDFRVDGGTSISRKHAQISREGERYFVCDLKSLNKTYLDGKELVPLEKTELFSGAHIRIADVEFIFDIRANSEAAAGNSH